MPIRDKGPDLAYSIDRKEVVPNLTGDFMEFFFRKVSAHHDPDDRPAIVLAGYSDAERFVWSRNIAHSLKQGLYVLLELPEVCAFSGLNPHFGLTSLSVSVQLFDPIQ